MATHSMNAATDPERFKEIVGILSRYPAVDESERDRVLQYLQDAPALDNALLTSVPEIKAQLAAFRTEHRRHFDIGLLEYTLVGLVLLALVVMAFFLWDIAA